MSDISNMSIDDLFRLLKDPLTSANAAIQKLRTGENTFNSVKSSFLSSLSQILFDAEEHEDYLKKNLVQDHLVIAFFGETNAGKSTIIDTFRILFNEETRNKAIKKANHGIFGISGSIDVGVDGTIVGDGRSDFTKTYDEYDMYIDGRKFTLIDVPGIEGNEAEYKDGIKKALQKVHCVFYVHGTEKKPNTKTTEKIREYLNDWVGVYSIQNIRGSSEQFDEVEERETLLTDRVLRAADLSENVFSEVLGSHYKGNMNIQGLLALCSQANFSPKRNDLKAIQSELLEYFGNADAIYAFSHFGDIIEEVRRMSTGYKDLILNSNKDKVIALALRAIKNINTCITQEKEAINDLDRKLAIFERNVSSTESKAKQNLNVNSLIESEFDKIRNALYQAIDTGNVDKVKSVANQQCRILETNLPRRIEEHCKNVTEWYLNELRRLKRNLNSSTNTNHLNISFNNITIGIDASNITKEMQDFDFSNAVKIAMSTAGIALLIPGVGWMLGGIIAIIGGIIGGVFGKDGRAEAKQKVDSTINDVSCKMIKELNNGVLSDLKNQYKKVSKELIMKIKKERSNIQNLKDDIEALKEEMKTTINIIRQYE